MIVGDRESNEGKRTTKYCWVKGDSATLSLA